MARKMKRKIEEFPRSGAFMRQRLAEFHRFVRETDEMFGGPFTLRMLGNAVMDMANYGRAVERAAEQVWGAADIVERR